APISLVQSVIAGGLVLLTVTADRLFAQEVTRREWLGVALAGAGLAFLAATIGGTGHSAHSDYEVARLAPYVAIAGLAGLALAAGAGDGDRGAGLGGLLTPEPTAPRYLRRSLAAAIGRRCSATGRSSSGSTSAAGSGSSASTATGRATARSAAAAAPCHGSSAKPTPWPWRPAGGSSSRVNRTASSSSPASSAEDRRCVSEGCWSDRAVEPNPCRGVAPPDWPGAGSGTS